MGSDNGTSRAACGGCYRVGQDRAGHWLAMEIDGRGGGMFASEEAAMRFARSATDFRPDAIILSRETICFV